MAGLNKVILIGNLGRDPELRYTQNGQAVVNFTLATNEPFTNKSGEREDRTEWHRIVVWGKQAEICNEYLTKGKQVYLEGRLQTRDWEDREGQKRRTTEIVAQQVLMLGRRDDGPGGGGGRGRGADADAGPAGSGGDSDPGPSDDDIPF